MKKLLLVITLALGIVGIAKAELMINPGFENDMSNWDNWGLGSNGSGAGSVTVLQDGTAHSGDKYIESGWDLGGTATSGFNYIFQNPLVTPGETYIFSAWVRDGWADPANPGAGTVPVSLIIEQRWFTGGGRGDISGPSVVVDFDIPSDGQWHFISTTHTAPLTVNQLTAIVSVKEVNYALDIDDMSLAPDKAYDPQPADGAIVAIELDTLAWQNPNPYDPAYPITCEVYFTTDFPEEGKYEDDPNFPKYAQSIQVNEDNISAIIPDALEIGQSYFWRVDCTDPNTGELFVGNIWKFATDNTAPVVDPGQDIHTWLTAGSTTEALDATVTDDGFPTPVTLTASWSVTEGDAGAVDFADDPASDDPEDVLVTLTAVGTYVLQLTADDGELESSQTITVIVHDNACNATKASGEELLPGDLNADCIVNLADLAIMAIDWSGCISLDCMN